MNSKLIDFQAVLKGSRPALARAATVLENDGSGAAELHGRLVSHCGRAHVVGVTGAPGAGKSTLISALLTQYLGQQRRVAVLAVDPSSPITGGALLGDRVRMEHASADTAFIRSMSSRGHLGGLSRSAGRIVDLFDAAGFDVVIVETVGTGQSEVEISHIADTNVLICPPGLGDSIQAIKAGILEIADILVVNKADLPSAAATARDLKAVPGLRHRGDWEVPVMLTVSTSGEGVAELVDRTDEHGRVCGIGRRLRRGVTAGTAVQTATDAVQATGATQATAGAAPQATDDELFKRLEAWRAAGKRVALATVVRTWGSSPRPEGSLLAVEEAGDFVGSVSGGCVEGAVISEALAAIDDGKPRMLEFGVSDEQAWDVGLACGGKVQVYVERVG